MPNLVKTIIKNSGNVNVEGKNTANTDKRGGSE
jgi:hypothetical protein